MLQGCRILPLYCYFVSYSERGTEARVTWLAVPFKASCVSTCWGACIEERNPSVLCSCPELVAFSGELESSTQVLTLQQHLTACASSLRHMLLAAKVSMLGLESAIAAIGPIISSLSQLRSVNICLQHCPVSNGISDNKQV